MTNSTTDATLARNRRARHDYEILETFTAGMVLSGTEVKSVRAGKAQIADGFIRVERGEAWLYNTHIAEYEQGNRMNHEPGQKRKLLLTKREIRSLESKLRIDRLTAVPLALYLERGWVKCSLGVGRGKRKWDKRNDIAARDAKRDVDREVARAMREQG